MGTVIKASEFAKKLRDIALNYKTLYVMGCFGAPLNAANKERYCSSYDYNRQSARKKMICAASDDTFGFDCVCLLKGVLWGWNGDTSKIYGGASYAANGVPDLGTEAMIGVCSGVTTDFSRVAVGEALWCRGHIGLYIGDGLAVECTPAWKNKVQITAVGNIGAKTGYNTRKWTKHGKLPYVEYDVPVKSAAAAKPSVKPSAKVDYAQSFDRAVAGRYKVASPTGLHIRTGASTSKTSIGVLPSNAVVFCYGYYSTAADGTKWLYIKTSDGRLGYCTSQYLARG